MENPLSLKEIEQKKGWYKEEKDGNFISLKKTTMEEILILSNKLERIIKK